MDVFSVNSLPAWPNVPNVCDGLLLKTIIQISSKELGRDPGQGWL